MTEQNRTQEALRESPSLYHSLVEQLPVGVFRKDAAGRFVLVNSEFCSLHGKDAEQLLGRTAQEVAEAHPAQPAVAPRQAGNKYYLAGARHHEQIMRTGENIEYEEHYPTADGAGNIYHVVKSPVFDADGKVTGSQGVLVDITARKRLEAEVERAHKQLVEASLQAGMAEVATSVLHNVGNVLNSVNVSSSLIADALRNSKVANLGKAVALMRAHEPELGNFLANDPKGKQLLEYLGNLATCLEQDRQDILRETATLADNISHIKEIVTVQQGYVKALGIVESVKVADLVEDALRLNSGAMARHHLKVVQEFAVVPPILVEKHKVLQILVNLIRNAKYACDDSGKDDKQITLRITGGENRVKIAVIDNGIGIPEENLTRIFNHGFTTRQEGHGFGLHSSANAAKTMGGILSVFSAGVGHGAAFTLELPLAQDRPVL
jgi:signal transduction histidine kinase